MRAGRDGMVLDVQLPAQPPAILVLEDQEEIRALVSAMLKIRGCGCDLAASLAEARALMARRRYDILFLDMNLPDGFGLSLVEEKLADAPLATAGLSPSPRSRPSWSGVPERSSIPR